MTCSLNNLMFRNNTMRSSLKALVSTLFLILLAACGGGGSVDRAPTAPGTPGTPGTGGTASPTVTVALSITDMSGQNNNQLDASTPLFIRALVTDADGNVSADTLVTFAFSAADLAVFDNDAGTGLTDANGIATIGLEVGQNSGDGLVTASVETPDGVFTGQVGFISAGIDPIVAVPATLEFFANSIQLSSSGSDEIELIAVVKNEQNILMEGVSVSFSADNQASLLPLDGGVTGADGIARATLTTTNPRNRVISVVASTGVLSEILEIDVIGTVVNVSGPTSVIINDPVPLTIVVADSDGNAIPNQVVELSTQNGTLDTIAPETGPTGQVTVIYTASESGTDTVTASSLNATGSIDLDVQQDDFSFTVLPQGSVELGESQTLAVTWIREGQPFVGGQVTFTSTRGTVPSAPVITNANGVASFSIVSLDAGIAEVSADGGSVTTRAQIRFIATEPATLIADATPDSIGPDGQTATINAVVRDSAGNLVTGQAVNFRLEDISSGSIAPSFAITDNSGIASAVYTSESVSSLDSVAVIAEVAEDTSITDTAFITVGDRAFDISLGTGREIQAPDASTYLKEFSVFVTDANSNPVENVQLTVSGTPVRFVDGGVYTKGVWRWEPIAEVYVQRDTTDCPNEDINGNGILDAGEDTNGDGMLTPGNVVSVPSDLTTDENGQAVIAIRYPKQFGGWTNIALRVSGQSSGSEAVQTQNVLLSVAADDLTEETAPPPANPFGSALSCTDPT